MELGPEPASQEEEPSVVEYARAQGICVNYTVEQLLVGDIDAIASDAFDRDLLDPSDAAITNATSELTKERLAVNRDTALFLKAVHSLQEVPEADKTTKNRREWMLSLKQELPLLKTDHELDLLNFGNPAMSDLKNLHIPSETVVEENDEGLEWPAKYLAYPAQLDAQIKAEKLAVSREVLVQLQNAIRDAYTPQDSEIIKAETLRPITPPLLPLSPPPTPYIPSSPANHLPLASSSSNSVAAEAQALQDEIMAADSLVRKHSDSSDSMLFDITHPPQFSPTLETGTMRILKRRAEDLKVEGPLTPPMFSTSPMKKLKSVSFADTLHEYIPSEPWNRDDVNDDGGDDQFLQNIKSLADKARRKVENEQLSGPDTITRVDVPEVDFSLPVAPWNEYSQRKGGKHRPGDTELQAQAKFLLRIKREELKSTTSWHGLSVPEREFHWSILTTKVSAIHLEEKLHGESEMNKIITEVTTGSCVTSSSLLWKREGLRILDDEEDEEEEELEPEEDEERRDMEALIRKRKLEMEEEAVEKHHRGTNSQQTVRAQIRPSRETRESHHRDEGAPPQQSQPKVRTKTFDHNRQKPQVPAARNDFSQEPRSTGTELMFGGYSATTALHKFMETRGKRTEPVTGGARKASNPSHAVEPNSHTLTVRESRSSSDQAETSAHNVQTQPQTTDGRQEHPIFHESPSTLPDIPKNLPPCSFIISSIFLQQRGMMKQIEQLYPQAQMVYRDYTIPHSAAKEAEILLSPSTGLIFTTIQQVKQRSLPGQPNRSPVKERMLALQLRHERLVVMVSEGLSRKLEELDSNRPEDPRDKEALRAFETFATQLDAEVLVKYVRGGEQALARSTVLEMVKYGLPHGSADIGDIKPVAEETSWEVFLRRVGLNPFAAQVIVAWLKQPFDVQVPCCSSPSFSSPRPQQSVSVSGLAGFLTMSEEERVRWFQASMGGSRILRRVSKLMDQEWVSAAHGFRM
ncbi:hypothetical protein BDW02DRAFT_539597 [Decorospora gaudefroyi]|uniref:Uncharacterized protein n=1 Tax=Decorospora gaudefroyi TaxID=184978 RepID=A0A6A5KQC1_9PLEO|nr:hypothetical protein BDW02DRAFT_539597 [Decorospora gaudefroyi]